MKHRAKFLADVDVPTIDLCDAIEPFEPHEPPIGAKGGSFTIDLHDDITESSTIAKDVRPHKHTLKAAAYLSVAAVRIITELGDGKISFRRYLLPEGMGCKVLIWLQQLRESSTGYPFQFEDVTTDPQVLIKGDDFLLETDRQLRGPEGTFKNNRRYGYYHPGYKRHFRIGGWRIVDREDRVVHENNDPERRPFEDFRQEDFQLYISFHHLH